MKKLSAFAVKRYQYKLCDKPLYLLIIILGLIMVINCKQGQSFQTVISGKEGKQDTIDSIPPLLSNLVQDSQNESRLKQKEMDTIETFDQLPKNYDPRLTALFRDSVPEDVIVSFYGVAAGKNPKSNYRWELHRDGRLFVVRHSGKNPSYEVTFDRPLPKKPTKILSQEKIVEIYTQLDKVDFFNQPKLQRRPKVFDGGYAIVRVRRGAEFNEVVYENVRGALEDYLYSITQ